MNITVSPKTAGQNNDMIVGFAIDLIDAPALTGSEKQIAWASEIRASAIQNAIEIGALRSVMIDGKPLANASFASPAVDAALAQVARGCTSMAAALATKTSAKAWIDATEGGKPSARTIQTIMRG